MNRERFEKQVAVILEAEKKKRDFKKITLKILETGVLRRNKAFGQKTVVFFENQKQA